MYDPLKTVFLPHYPLHYLVVVKVTPPPRQITIIPHPPALPYPRSIQKFMVLLLLQTMALILRLKQRIYQIIKVPITQLAMHYMKLIVGQPLAALLLIKIPTQ
jgi:hypothetical protein